MKFIKLIIIFLLLFTFFNQNVFADFEKKKVDKISKNLRCLICQGQSVYESQSDFAESMKILIGKKIKEGKSEQEIYDTLKSQYGEWIIYEPEFNKKTYFLWLFPLILFITCGLLIVRKAFIN